MLNTFLCDELDKSALRLAFAVWRGEAVDPPQAKLAVANTISYGVYLTPDSLFSRSVTKPGVVSSFSAASDDEVGAAFEDIIAVKADASTGEKAALDGKFLKLVVPALLKLLVGFLV